MIRQIIKPKSVARCLSTNTKLPTESSQSNVLEADITSGVPLEVSARTVRIYRPAKTAMQSGLAGMKNWKIDFDVQQRWGNELMGWSSSADALQALRVQFNTKEDAIAFAQKQGYNYVVEEPKETKFKVRSYAANFKYNPKKLTWHHTK
ncbi:ETC complex I subunit conserved region-domain-containing protein [Globomyces pollinis-pini]|nr:ETC complex I subunit conserved region-domain-containing protein [Globomyces pollinis-pini]